VPIARQILKPDLRLRVGDGVEEGDASAGAGGIEVEGGPVRLVESSGAGFEACK
jgi:hypothetical protein